jgi:ankyrin repeat protein
MTKPAPGELIKAVSNYDPHYHSDIDLVKIVLDAGANPNGKDRKTGETPLHIALKNDNGAACELVKLLIEIGANLEATTKTGETPLMYAATYDNITALNLLIEKGVSLDKKNLSGRDALGCANDGYIQWIGHGYIPRSSTINAPVSEAVEILAKAFNEKAAREAADAQKKKIAELHNIAAERQDALKKLRHQPKPRTP